MLRARAAALRRYSTTNAKLFSDFKNPDLIKTLGYVNGKWVPGSGNQTFQVNNPAIFPQELAFLAQVADLSHTDLDSAIVSAASSFQTFKKSTGRHRSELLLNLYELMRLNENDLARLIVLENGKPFADAIGEVRYSASFLQWFSEEAPRIYGDVINSANPTNRIITLKQPIGVCGIITPWNFPSAMITRKLGAAIAAGCTTVIKPASETPLSALALAHLAEQAGFPAGVVNVIPSSDNVGSGKMITEHPLVLKVSFTGSTAVGKILMNQSASTLKKLSMELGGNAPFIVFEDADIEKAAAGAIAAKFRSSGQTCVCANRIFVHESVYDKFVAAFCKLVKEKTRLGNGLTEGVTHGPLIHQKSMHKVRSHIEDAKNKGAKVLLGGNKSNLGENFHELTVLGDVTTEMDVANEETFGPVAPIFRFADEQDVIRISNLPEVGLAGYFFSNDIRRIFRVAEELHVGMIGVNTGAISEAALPFGGVGESGFGREGSKYGIDDYLVVKSLVLGGIE